MRTLLRISDGHEPNLTSLSCLAAAMVLPRHVYVTDGNEVYEVDRGTSNSDFRDSEILRR